MLTLSEAGRAIVRARTTGRLTVEDEQAAVRALRTFERRCFLLDVDRAVLDRVRRSFPVEPIRTPDAIHLATAELLDLLPEDLADLVDLDVHHPVPYWPAMRRRRLASCVRRLPS